MHPARNFFNRIQTWQKHYQQFPALPLASNCKMAVPLRFQLFQQGSLLWQSAAPSSIIKWKNYQTGFSSWKTLQV